MKKKAYTILLAILMTTGLTACSNNIDWTVDTSGYDEGWLEYQEDLLDKALAAIEEDETDVVNIFEAALRYEYTGDFKNAVKYYEWVIELDPNYALTYNNLAAIYEELKVYDLAAENVKAYYDRNQSSTGAIKDTVRILLKNDELDSAELAFENFVFLTSEDTSDEMRALWSLLQDQIYEYKQENGLTVTQ